MVRARQTTVEVSGRPSPPVDLVASIFDAARDERLWPDVLARMTAWVGGVVGGLQIRRLVPEVSMSIVSSGLDPDFARTYAEEYFLVDPHLAHVAALGEGQSLLSRQLLADRAYRGSRFVPPYLAGVATGLARGLSDKELADQLGISHSTARTCVARVMRRLGVRDRRELMRRRRGT